MSQKIQTRVYIWFVTCKTSQRIKIRKIIQQSARAFFVRHLFYFVLAVGPSRMGSIVSHKTRSRRTVPFDLFRLPFPARFAGLFFFALFPSKNNHRENTPYVVVRQKQKAQHLVSKSAKTGCMRLSGRQRANAHPAPLKTSYRANLYKITKKEHEK